MTSEAAPTECVHSHACPGCGHTWWHDPSAWSSLDGWTQTNEHTCPRCGAGAYAIRDYVPRDYVPRDYVPRLNSNQVRTGTGISWTGWTAPPHPICVVPSFDAHASPKDQAREILRTFHYDDDVRNWADRDETRNAFGAHSKGDYDPEALILAYENPGSAVWSKPGMNWHDLDAAVHAAIARRMKLGPLPPATYNTDPISIPYYDNDHIKKVTYPRSSLVSSKGGALDPGNLKWWTAPGATTYEMVSDGSRGWGGEGFDWNRDVVGHVGEIVGAIMEGVGFILTVIPFTTAAGAAIMALAPVVGALLQSADTAFQGGDMGAAMGNIASSILELANKQLGEKTGIKMDSASLQKLGTSLGSLAADAAGLQAHYGGNFTDTWTAIAQSALSGKYGPVGTLASDDAKDAILKTMGDPAAQLVFKKGWEIAQYADPATLGAVSQLFTDSGAMHLFQFGAGLGLVKRASDQAAKTAKSVVSSTAKGKMTMTSGTYVGDFGQSMGSAFGSALGSLLSTAASEGSKAIDQQLAHAYGAPPQSPQAVLAALIAQLGVKYNMFPSAVAHPAVTGAFPYVGQYVGQTMTEEVYDAYGNPVTLEEKRKGLSFSKDVLPALPAVVELAAAALPFVAGPTMVGAQSIGWWDSRYDFGQVGDGGGGEYWGTYPGEYSIEGGQ